MEAGIGESLLAAFQSHQMPSIEAILMELLNEIATNVPPYVEDPSADPKIMAMNRF